jgi:hypothetical protein
MAAPPTMTVFSLAAMPAAASTDNAAHVMMNLRNILPLLLVSMSFSPDYGAAAASD